MRQAKSSLKGKRLTKASQVDALLRYPNGHSSRLARKGLIPHLVLPDGGIRFDEAEIRSWMVAGCPPQTDFECSTCSRACSWSMLAGFDRKKDLHFCQRCQDQEDEWELARKEAAENA